MDNAIELVFQIAILIFSVIIHEVSHGYAALWLGDRTAYYAGRLTLNPIPHIDPFGSILLPLFSLMLGGPLFGWAKPVPFNPYNLRSREWGPAIVGIAGPASNFLLALFASLIVRFAPVGNSTIFWENFVSIASYVAIINLFLFVFNLVPIPPLDGSKVLFSLLPYQWEGIRGVLEQYGFFLLLLFIFFFSHWLVPIVRTLFFFLAGNSF